MKLIMRFDVEERGLLFYFPESPYKQKLLEICKKCAAKYNGYAMIDLSAPYKSRTTGKGSQNNKFYALVTRIARETGNDIEDVKDGIKERALKRGYPYKINSLTNSIKPLSTTKINTVEMSYLIDECIQVCSELGIIIDNNL